MLDILDSMMADMGKAPPEFRPTQFWERALIAIVSDLKSRGFETFRSHPSAMSFYVPTYAPGPYTGRHRIRHGMASALLRSLPRVLAFIRDRQCRRLAETILNGSLQAEADYRIFLATASPSPPRLDQISESDLGQPSERFLFDGNRYSRSMLNYLRGLNLLKRVSGQVPIRSVFEIGGGYGTLGEIMTHADPPAFYLDVDIPPVAAVATWYLSSLLGREHVLTYDVSRDMPVIDLEGMGTRFQAAVLCPWQLPRVRGRFDLFVNYISFQEMEPSVVQNYTRLVQPLVQHFVLLRNSRHGKIVAKDAGTVGVVKPTTMDDMLGFFDQFSLLARDHRVFGDQSPDGRFQSEVCCLKRA